MLNKSMQPGVDIGQQKIWLHLTVVCVGGLLLGQPPDRDTVLRCFLYSQTGLNLPLLDLVNLLMISLPLYGLRYKKTVRNCSDCDLIDSKNE